MPAQEHKFTVNKNEYTGRLDYKALLGIEKATGKTLIGMYRTGGDGVGLTEQTAILAHSVQQGQPGAKLAKLFKDIEEEVNATGMTTISEIAAQLVLASGMIGDNEAKGKGETPATE